VNDAVHEAVTEHGSLADQVQEVTLRLNEAEANLAEMRTQVDRLDHDLDESRRLNLRAAELLDLVYAHLTGEPGVLGNQDPAAAGDVPGAALHGKGALR
jgi:chromosome segregation ATPase